MAFDKLEALVKSGRAGLPASVALSVMGKSGGGGRPRCRVSFSAAFAAEAAIKDAERFDVLLGTGEQKGLLRLKRSKKGVAEAMTLPKSGGVSFNLGYIERFGSEPEERQYCNATLVDADTIEVVLPSWADEQEG